MVVTRGLLHAHALVAALTVMVGAVAGAASARSATIHVALKDIGFSPSAITAHVGDTIVFDNMDFVAHTATAVEEAAFDVTIDPGKSASVTVTRAGLAHYYCQYHPNMTGTISVAAN